MTRRFLVASDVWVRTGKGTAEDGRRHARGERAGVTCSNCGRGSLSREYTLRFTLEDGHTRELDLFLCTDCLEELCREPEIETVRNAAYLPRE